MYIDARIKIIEFLRKNHKHFDRLDEKCFDAWETAWWDSAQEGYAHIEIESNNSHTGAPIILDSLDDSMKKYNVTVTGTWNMDIEADSPEEAERLARIKCIKDDLDVWTMNLEFEAFNDVSQL